MADNDGIEIPRDILHQYKRWESGRCRPSPFYVDLLVKVFGPIAGLEPNKGNPRAHSARAYTAAPDPAAELVAAIRKDVALVAPRRRVTREE